MKAISLKEICTLKQWKTIPAKEMTETGYPVYGANGIIGFYSDWNHDEPTIMICCRGATCGAINVSKEKCYINGNAMCLDNLSNSFDFNFVVYFLKHYDFNRVITGAAQPQITQTRLENVYIPIVGIDKQKEISLMLANIEKAITNENEILEKYNELIKSRFIEMFGDPLNKSLHNKKFTECVCFNPKKNEVKELKELEVSFVPMECVGTDGSFSIKKDGLLGEFYKGYTYFRDGDVLLAKITPCFENGKIAIAKNCKNGIGFGTTEFHVSRPISGISNSYWIQGLLQNDKLHQYGASKMMGSAGQKRIQTPFFENLNVFLPPIEDQNEFASFVKQINKLRFISQKRIAYLEELLNKEMDEAFN